MAALGSSSPRTFQFDISNLSSMERYMYEWKQNVSMCFCFFELSIQVVIYLTLIGFPVLPASQRHQSCHGKGCLP